MKSVPLTMCYPLLVLCAFALQGCHAAVTLTHVSSVLLPSSFINASAKDAFLAGLEEPYIVDGNGGAAGVIMTDVTETGTPEYFPDFQGKVAVSQMLKGGAEQTAWLGTYKLIISVGEGGIVSLVDASTASMKVHQAIDMGSTLTDVEVCGDHIVVTAEGPQGKAGFGKMHILKIDPDTKKATELDYSPLDTGHLPDMLHISTNCKVIAVANEGEATFDAADNFVNPEGSVSVYTFTSLDAAPTSTVKVEFQDFNAKASQYVQQGVFWVLRPDNKAAWMNASDCTFSKDLEPEYLAFSSDENTIYINLQENNAVVTIDISDSAAPKLGGLFALGFQSWADYKIDTSDKDDGVHMVNYPGVYGLGQPDTMKLFAHGGDDYIVVAMEGDAKEYESNSGDREWTDEEKGAKFAGKMSADAPTGLAEALADNNQLARVRVSTARGAVSEGTFDEAVYDKVFLYGARGFNIYKASAEGMSQVYTSGDAVEHYHMTHFPEIYNSEMNEDDFSETLRAGHDSRSDNKGSEPEGLAVATLSSGKRVVFVGSERTSVIGVFDISDPAAPVFQSAVATGDSSVSFNAAFMAGGLLPNMDPEDMHFIPAAESPLGTDTLLVVGALNGVINLYTIDSAESNDRSTYVMEKEAYVAENGAGATKKTAADWACEAGAGGTSKVLEHFKMVGVKLADLNPFLVEDEMDEVPAMNTCLGRNDQFHCRDFPSVFSGMSLAQGSVSGSAVFLGVSDNGPNNGCGNLADGATMQVTDASGKGFPVQNFSPIISAVTVNSNGLVEKQSSCYLKLKDGSPASGMPTSPSDDTPFGPNCQTAQLAYDHNGFDPEDVHQIPGTPYCWAVEEYSPSAVVFHCDMSDSNMCGVVEARYVPESVKLSNAGYKVHSILPDVYTQRRKNRGFEGGGVSPDGKLAYAFMQSPMLGDADNTILRFLEFDISDPLNAKVVGEYLYQGEDPAVAGNWADTTNVAKDLKISAAQWYGEDMSTKHLLVLERAKGQVKVFLVDLSSATNVLAMADSATLSYEIAPAAFAAKYAASITTAPKTIVFDTATTEGWTHSMKQEGFTLLNDCVMAFGDDNDFGLEGNTEAGVVTVQLGVCVNTLANRTTAACKPYGAFTQGEAMLTFEERRVHDLEARITMLETMLTASVGNVTTLETALTAVQADQAAEDEDDDDDDEAGVILGGLAFALAITLVVAVGVLFVRLGKLSKATTTGSPSYTMDKL